MSASRTQQILVIVPTFGHFDYARRTLETLFAVTPNTSAIVVDDGSPGWHEEWFQGVCATKGSIAAIHFPDNRGLTRAWNVGFHAAFSLPQLHRDTLLVAGNSDLLFTPGWERPLLANTRRGGHAFAGPTSNAPGVSSAGLQDLCTRTVEETGYRATDDPAANAMLATALRRRHGDAAVPCNINGFLMAGRLETWRHFAHEAPTYMFPPEIKTMPSGRVNPTPRMTGQEDWLNARVRAAGGRNATCPGSFVFHYRSVTRGVGHAVGDWTRMSKKETAP